MSIRDRDRDCTSYQVEFRSLSSAARRCAEHLGATPSFGSKLSLATSNWWTVAPALRVTRTTYTPGVAARIFSRPLAGIDLDIIREEYECKDWLRRRQQLGAYYGMAYDEAGRQLGTQQPRSGQQQ
jgi:hypothetical protein